MNCNLDLAVLAYMGYKIETVDGEDLTEVLSSLNPPIFDGRDE